MKIREKERKRMNKNQMKKIENEIISIMNDMNIEIERDENEKILISERKRDEIRSYLESEISDEDFNSFFEKKNQIHISRDRDIKIDMRKIDNFNLKIIYHRKKDNSLEYRIFISFKDEEKNLKRIRMINDSIREISEDEKKMILFFNKIKKNQIEEYLKEKIS